jgi:two-component system response regulator DesR
MKMTRAIFATRQPLLIAGVREVLTAAGIRGDPQVVHPEELSRILSRAECLVILDGQALPSRESLSELRRFSPGSHFVVWSARPTADLLQAAVECGLHGLLSTRLPLDEAAHVLRRICRGERLFRFDADPGPLELPKPFKLSAREQQALFVLAEGASNAAIAAVLHTTESTVKVCMSRMFRKTGARNRQELMALCRCGVLTAQEPLRQESHAAVSTTAAFDAQWMLHGEDSRQGGI